ncbi:fructose-bisphosphate aldolase class I [Candidatus Poseidoniales archaeon]|nr:fructose-bisphosphate aldolase class I [Candidatus Thalassarchaeaceae archaeon]MDC0041049.1 fructose-bisphosphate aldolase class I [Candidatus Poseidoniales archaeon]MDC0149371.1 fructose-bisphosphate aldolase class I [Candidatus Poseidoniales archaeon]RCH71759.1 MAG: fructose-bisphosphate aldolase class I [Candidatus Poseidoniales archaeon]RCH72506.1 MAG: fructose-bisphosphate aldolase class I [Candidatus Poseidoniales archaeon]|tara:strand:- start:3071 stop:4081 length:1011 start_codon:yes stop_codon:yes gene_type:complete
MDTELLEKTARELVAPGRGILAADESNGTMSNRLAAVGVEPSPEARRSYRSNIFATSDYQSAISGVILFDETIRQKMNDGTPIPEYLASRGVHPGIKVDTGAKELAHHSGEKITEGLDGLRERCAEYFAMGARFAKWRAVIRIGDGMPSDANLSTNAHALARYAAICQEQGLVPIIEPEVLMDGEHDAQTCYDVTARILDETFAACEVQGVHIPGALLKPNMILPGKSCSDQGSREQAAQLTVDCLTNHVPHNLPGIVFLSGGQSDEDATAHLNLMNGMDVEHPWQLSYSYGRALLAHALQTWASGSNEDSQGAFAHRAAMNSLARTGAWSAELES